MARTSFICENDAHTSSAAVDSRGEVSCQHASQGGSTVRPGGVGEPPNGEVLFTDTRLSVTL